MLHLDPLSLGSRREFLRRIGMGLGGVAMASLLQQELRGADIRVELPETTEWPLAQLLQG